MKDLFPKHFSARYECCMAFFSPLSQAQLEKLTQFFALPQVRRFEGVAEGSVNSIFILQTEKEDFFLRLEEVKSRAEVESELSFLAYLHEKGFPCPQPRRHALTHEWTALVDGKI